VREGARLGLHALGGEFARDVLSEIRMRASRDDDQSLFAVGDDAGHFDSDARCVPLGPAGVSSFAASLGCAFASAAACAAAVPSRLAATQPGMLRCGATLIARAPAGTSLRMTAPAPV